MRQKAAEIVAELERQEKAPTPAGHAIAALYYARKLEAYLAAMESGCEDRE